MAVIYRITNMINNKYYIGSAESFARREWQHRNDLKRGVHKNPHLQASWNKYGEDAFVFEVLEEVPEGISTFEHENKYLHEHVSKPECYNINTDAIGMRTGIPHTEETKALLSAKVQAALAEGRGGKFIPSKETREKMSKASEGNRGPKGHIRSEEHRRSLSIANAGNQNWLGKTHTEETKNKLRRAVFARLPDGQTRIFAGLSVMRDELGVSIATTIRACGSGKPVKCGVLAGWVLSYADAAPNQGPSISEEYASYPRTRQAAKAAGSKEYFTGMPCVRGHISPRKVKGSCTACMREDWKTENARRALKGETIDTSPQKA
jgi:group I intron endonuclease